IKQQIDREETKFRKTLESGLKEFAKLATAGERISGADAFTLFSTYGMPIEMIEELAVEAGGSVDRAGFAEEYRTHQELSKAGAGERFKGGLAGTGSEMEVRYHTATHLLNAGLRHVLGEHVGQKGSNITTERLRFDFNHPEKLTDEQKQQIEEFVNTAIQDDLPVSVEEVPLQKAYDDGAVGVFGETYPDTVKVYTIGNDETGVRSKEICGGPHVERTGELGGTFRIKKEESVSAGVRRIKAVIE
ncbi:MAG: alanine--tRNA ligase-related protein, partial [Candidatus Paceibacterota bacterium]